MAARFDPVRDSAASPSKKHASLDQRTSQPGTYNDSVSEDEGGSRRRKPSRSASIADILNDEPPRHSRRSVSGDHASEENNHHERIGYLRSPYLGSSPSSSSIGKQSSVLGFDHHDATSSNIMRRQSSSHSNASSQDQSLHPHHQNIYSAQQQSPSLLHLLNSESSRNLSNSPSSLPRPYGQGPSFAGAGGLSILSPTSEEAPHGRYSGGSHQDSRRGEGMYSASVADHQTHDQQRHNQAQPGSQSQFAVPEVPSRSPDALRSKKSLPIISTSLESAVSTVSPNHFQVHDSVGIYSREARTPILQYPVTPGSQIYNTGHAIGTPRFYSPHGSNGASPRELTPSRVGAPLPSPMEIPPTPGEYIHSERQRATYFASHEASPMTGNDQDLKVEPRSWMDPQSRQAHPQQLENLNQIKSDGWLGPDGKFGEERDPPPAKRRKGDSSKQSDNIKSQQAEANAKQGPEEDKKEKIASEQPKRGRPKGRKSISKSISEDVTTKTEAKPDVASFQTVRSESEKDYSIPTVSDIDMKDLKAASTIASSNALLPVVAPSPPKPAYRPTKRVSIPTTIRVPVTVKQVDEMRYLCQNSLRQKWQSKNPSKSDGFNIVVANFASQISVASSSSKASSNGTISNDVKRKREALEIEENNAKLVAQHYNSRQDQGLGARKQSPILPLRNFNNWIKSVIINSNATKGGRVLDLGGGKGGDLNKWDKAQISEYILCDIAEISIQQAESRFRERRYHFQARFFSFDCFAFPLADNIPKDILEPLFDTVSLQFCLHYGWETVSKAQLMLENIARYLKPGGIFVGTIPNADLLRSRLNSAMSNSPPKISFGNQYYEVNFGSNDEKMNLKCPPFGHKYKFTLLDAVDDVAEYVVDWDQLVSLANQNGLECTFKKTFDEIWHQEGQMDSNQQELARKMKIYPNGADGIPMNEELWEATNLYIAFAFKKKPRIA